MRRLVHDLDIGRCISAAFSGNCSFLQSKMKLQMMRTEKLCRAELPRSILQPQSRCGGSCSCD